MFEMITYLPCDSAYKPVAIVQWFGKVTVVTNREKKKDYLLMLILIQCFIIYEDNCESEFDKIIILKKLNS